MSNATITVKYVNEPREGSKKGTIKGVDGEIFGVWADKLDRFEVGQTYDIEYETSEWKGKTYRTVKGIKSRAAAHASAPSTNGPGPATGGSRDEHIFVCGVINNAVRAGILPLGVSEIAHAVRTARGAYKAGFGSNPENDFPDDEIPF